MLQSSIFDLEDMPLAQPSPRTRRSEMKQDETYAQMSAMESQIEETSTLYEQAKAEKTALEAAKRQLEQRQDEMALQIKAMEKQIDEDNATVGRLVSENASLRTWRYDTKRQQEAMEKEMNSMRDRTEASEKRLSTVEASLVDTKSCLAREEERCKKANEAKKSWQDRALELEWVSLHLEDMEINPAALKMKYGTSGRRMRPPTTDVAKFGSRTIGYVERPAANKSGADDMLSHKAQEGESSGSPLARNKTLSCDVACQTEADLRVDKQEVDMQVLTGEELFQLKRMFEWVMEGDLVVKMHDDNEQKKK